MKSPALVIAGVAAVAVASFALLTCSLSARAAEPHSANPPGKLITYTIKQFSLDGKPLGQWTTRESPWVADSDSCVRWRANKRQDSPVTTVCGGILQITADEQPLAVIQ